MMYFARLIHSDQELIESASLESRAAIAPAVDVFDAAISKAGGLTGQRL